LIIPVRSARYAAEGSIVGVLADIHTQSLHKGIQPLELGYQTSSSTVFNISLAPSVGNTDVWKTTIAAIGRKYKEVFPKGDFSYSLLYQKDLVDAFITEHKLK